MGARFSPQIVIRCEPSQLTSSTCAEWEGHFACLNDSNELPIRVGNAHQREELENYMVSGLKRFPRKITKSFPDGVSLEAEVTAFEPLEAASETLIAPLEGAPSRMWRKDEGQPLPIHFGGIFRVPLLLPLAQAIYPSANMVPFPKI